MGTDHEADKGLPGAPRRRDSRHTVRRAVWIRCPGWEDFRVFHTLDVSKRGLLVSMDLPPAEGTTLRLRLTFVGGAQREIGVLALRVQPPPPGETAARVGMAVSDEEEDRRSMEQWCATIAGMRATDAPPAGDAPPRGLGDGERRSHERHPLRREVMLRCNEWQDFERLYTVNISQGGMLVRMNTPPVVESALDLRLGLPDGTEVTLAGRVARVEPPPPGRLQYKVGVQLDLDPDTAEMLEAYLDGARRSETSDLVFDALAALDDSARDVAGTSPPPPQAGDVQIDDRPNQGSPPPPGGSEEATQVARVGVAARPPLSASAPIWSGPVWPQPGESAHDDGPILAIDLGTWSCRAAWMDAGALHLVTDPSGAPEIPAVVWGRDREEYIVGYGARRCLGVTPQAVVHSLRRLLGRDPDDPVTERIIRVQRCPLDVSEDGTISLELGEVWITAEEATSLIVRRARELASEQAGHDFRRAVVTVPPPFRGAPLRSFEQALRLGGLEVEAIIPEPVAAAIAHGLTTRDGLVAVYDFGGGSFDLSILEIDDGHVKVLAAASDPWLGGEDLDRALAQRAAEEFHQVSGGHDLRRRLQDWWRLKLAAEKTKRNLSAMKDAEIRLPGAATTDEGRLDLVVPVTFDAFEALVGDLVWGTLATCERALVESGRNKSGLSEVVLVGGTSRLPMVRSMGRRFFGREPVVAPRPETAVVRGAAMVAAHLRGSSVDDLPVMGPLRSSRRSVGLAMAGGMTDPMIPSATQLPAQAKRIISTARTDQEQVQLQIVQGDSAYTKENETLGVKWVTDLPKGPAGAVEVEVLFLMDEPDLLTVEVRHLASRSTTRFVFALHGGEGSH